jgi:disease resistance protein RPM1
MAVTVTVATVMSLAGPAVSSAQQVITQINSMKPQQKLKHKTAMATMQQDVIALKDDMELMQSFLMDLGFKRGQSHILKTYVWLVRDLAYDGEDCLQEFLLFLEQPPRASPKLLLTQDEIATMLKNLGSKIISIREKLRYCVDASGLGEKTCSGIGTPLPRVKSPAILSNFSTFDP